MTLLLALGACGDGASDGDAGSAGDGDGDASGGDGDGDEGGGDGDGNPGLPRLDAGADGDPIPPCDRFDQFGCGAGQKCGIVIRRAPDEETYGVYNGCVDVLKERGLGAPCVQWSVAYALPGLVDEVWLDPCEQGLVCAADASVPGLFTCQQSCQSGRYRGLPGRFCGEAGQYCSTVEQNPYLEWCVQSAGCDPTDPLACGEGAGCYLRPGDVQDEALSECYPTFEPAVADGDLCQYINDCAAGSLCWGPVRVPPGRWQDDEIRCRKTCVPGGADADGGDDDAGAGADDTCDLGQTCVPFGESGLELGTIGASFGQCE